MHILYSIFISAIYNDAFIMRMTILVRYLLYFLRGCIHVLVLLSRCSTVGYKGPFLYRNSNPIFSTYICYLLFCVRNVNV